MSTAALEAKRHARGPWAERLGRFGFAAKGVLYGVVALIAAQVAVGEKGRPEDKKGALQLVAEQPLGEILLGILAAGLGGYALWRLIEAALGPKDEDGAKALGKRLVSLVKGVVYAGLCAAAIGILAGSGTGGSGSEKKAAGTLLELPAGVWLVTAVGLGLVVVGLFNGYRGVTLKFCDDLRSMGATEERWVKRIGVVGHLARLVVFGLIGVFLVKAALEYDPDEAVGLDGALLELVRQPLGPYLLGLVAFGLFAYGLFCLIEARYREL
jgi:Domain of Unknown Function (DUF1206)